MTLEEILEKVKQSSDFANDEIGRYDWIPLSIKEITHWNTLKTEPIKTYYYISYRNNLEDKLLIVQQSNQEPSHFRWLISSLLFSVGHMSFTDDLDSSEKFGDN